MENKSGLEFLGSDSEYDVVEGLSTWEFINPSDDDDDEDVVDFAFSSSSSEDENEDHGDVIGPKEEGPGPYPTGSPSSSDHMPMKSLNYLLALGDAIGLKGEEGPFANGPPSADQSVNYLLALEDDDYVNDDAEEEEEDDEEEYDDEYDLDDELVPNGVRGRIGRERIKKLGKRGGYSRMKKAKKLPYYYNRPGCVHGKHGLGVQHSYI